MKYTIKQGNIASIIKVNDKRFCYLKKGMICYLYLPDEDKGIRVFEALPEKVKKAVKDQFNQIFSLPVEKRGEYIKNLKEKTI